MPTENHVAFTTIFTEEEKSQICENILRSLPQWFGIESAIIDYVNDVKKWILG